VLRILAAVRPPLLAKILMPAKQRRETGEKQQAGIRGDESGADEQSRKRDADKRHHNAADRIDRPLEARAECRIAAGSRDPAMQLQDKSTVGFAVRGHEGNHLPAHRDD